MLRTSVVWATLLAAASALAIPTNASAEEWVPPPRTTSAPPTQSRRVDASGWQLAGAVTMAAGAGIGWLGFIGCLSAADEDAATSPFVTGVWITAGSVAGVGLITLGIATFVQIGSTGARPGPDPRGNFHPPGPNPGNFVPSVDVKANSQGARLDLAWSF